MKSLSNTLAIFLLVTTLSTVPTNANDTKSNELKTKRHFSMIAIEKEINSTEAQIKEFEDKGIANLTGEEFERLDKLQDKILFLLKQKKSMKTKNRVLFRYIRNDPEKIELIKKLIKAGADVNAKDNLNQTPLLYAAYYNKEAVTEILLKAGASPLGENGKDKTPTLTYVAEQGHKNILNLFLKYGLDRKKVIEAMKEAILQKKKTLSAMEESLSETEKLYAVMGVKIKLDTISSLMQSSRTSKNKNQFKQQQEIKQKKQEIKKLQNAYCVEKELKNDEACMPLKEY
jgi:hypothetical protein